MLADLETGVVDPIVEDAQARLGGAGADAVDLVTVEILEHGFQLDIGRRDLPIVEHFALEQNPGRVGEQSFHPIL